MPLRLSSPIVKDFDLPLTDSMFNIDGTPTRITVKQASQMDNERRSLVLANNTRILDDDPTRIKIKSEWSMEELKRWEVFLTLVGCNIETAETGALFKFKTEVGTPALDMTMPQFEKAWGLLPGEVANEIYSKVLEVNYDWSNPLMG